MHRFLLQSSTTCPCPPACNLLWKLWVMDPNNVPFSSNRHMEDTSSMINSILRLFVAAIRHQRQATSWLSLFAWYPVALTNCCSTATIQDFTVNIHSAMHTRTLQHRWNPTSVSTHGCLVGSVLQELLELRVCVVCNRIVITQPSQHKGKIPQLTIFVYTLAWFWLP